MLKKLLCCFFLLIMMVTSCKEEHVEILRDNEFVSAPYRIRMEQKTDSLFVLRLFVDEVLMDTLSLPYPVYRFDAGDLTGDSIPEVAVGVIKSTKYWKEPAKRLFIYRLYHGRYIRPLWLGSRVGSPLVDFKVCRDSFPAVIHTTEMNSDSTTFGAIYRIQGFGLKYVGPLFPKGDSLRIGGKVTK